MVIPPVPLTVQAGDRAYVIAYGTTPANLRLMVLPILVLAGDPPLLAPKPSPTTSAALDPCTLVSKADAAAAMGGPVTDTKDDIAAGTCEYDGAGTMVSVALQTDFNRTVFDAAKPASNTVTVSGLGDAAYSTTQPVNGLFVLKGKTFVAIGLNRHVDGGQDDPAQDGPVIKDLMSKALSVLP